MCRLVEPLLLGTPLLQPVVSADGPESRCHASAAHNRAEDGSETIDDQIDNGVRSDLVIVGTADNWAKRGCRSEQGNVQNEEASDTETNAHPADAFKHHVDRSRLTLLSVPYFEQLERFAHKVEQRERQVDDTVNQDQSGQHIHGAAHCGEASRRVVQDNGPDEEPNSDNA